MAVPLSLALAAAALLRVGVSDVDADGVSAFIARQLSQLVVADTRDAGCVDPVLLRDQAADSLAELQGCFGQQACLASVGKQAGFDKLVLGNVRKLDDALLLQLLVFDVARRRVERQVTERLPARPDALRDGLKRLTPSICAALSPAWAEAQTGLAIQIPALVADDLPIPELSRPPVAAAKPAPAPPAPLDLPLPPVPDEPPPPPRPAPALVQTPPPAPKPALVPQPPPAPKPAPVVVKSKPSLPPAAAAPPPVPAAKEPSRPTVWWPTALAAASGAGLAGGIALGVWAQNLRASDAPIVLHDRVLHTMTRADALTANRAAIGANVAFTAAGALAAGSVLGFVLVPASRPAFLVEGQF